MVAEETKKKGRPSESTETVGRIWICIAKEEES